MFTTILLRGNKAPVVRTDSNETRAFNRADTLLDLHGLNISKLTFNSETRTFTVDASSYYQGI